MASRAPRIYVGGPVGLVPEIVLGELEVDAVVVGEGEEVVADLVEGGPSEEISGLAFLRDGVVVKTDPIPVSDLDHVMPLIPDDLRSQSVRGANVYIETHRGCLEAAPSARSRGSSAGQTGPCPSRKSSPEPESLRLGESE